MARSTASLTLRRRAVIFGSVTDGPNITVRHMRGSDGRKCLYVYHDGSTAWLYSPENSRRRIAGEAERETAAWYARELGRSVQMMARGES